MGALFQGGGGGAPIVMQPPQAPEPPKPLVMPQADPEAQKKAAMKDLAQKRASQTTRAATIIGSDDTLG